MKNSLIILSGGMDSVTLLYDQKDYIALAVTFDYGSNHNKREDLCKTMRGVRNDGNMCVSHFTGVFQFNSELRKEFYKLIDFAE